MIRRYHMALNVISFQIGWFACVLFAAQQQPVVGSAIALVMVVFNIWLSVNRKQTLALVFTISLIGFAWDSVLSQMQILVFTTGLIHPYLAPHWILMMWLLFATTLSVSLRWLYQRFWLSLLLGAIAGPLAYLGGASLGAVIIPDHWLATLVLALGWAGLLPLFMKTAWLIEQSSRTRMAAS